MDTMMKSIITEKDLLRQILLLEELSNHKTITAKALAASIQTTERTVFTDIQYIREHLPDGWEIETTSNGFSLLKKDSQLTNQLWESFLPLSIGAMLIKQLFFAKGISTQSFLHDSGISFETLKRHVTKINRGIKPYNIRIQLNAKQVKLSGSEISIRVFFHRLLLPFTHNNYFFEDYAIHESHYLIFLQSLKRQELDVLSEEIFGTCWFFINTIRIKANCRVNALAFDPLDPLFLQYHQSLQQVYQKEGVYLNQEECFFSFYCFLESWNYNNQWTSKIAVTLDAYQEIKQSVQRFVQELGQELAIPLLSETQLADNLLLLVLKFNESAKLSEQFQLEYQEMMHIRQHNYQAIFERLRKFILDPKFAIVTDEPKYILNMASLLVQQAVLQARPVTTRAFFFFQGEPAWKVFLQQEISDYLGSRIELVPVEPAEFAGMTTRNDDFIISNVPLDDPKLPVFYLSMLPTKNELNQLTELIQTYYLINQ
ncbi:helix-turn-helix domain-containing protein [Enterococcus gallinarum]|uniref:helix-turn-helix domain-containing protein n=1 Tax=Enterococcus gallinarum TaxID=1353 RepID=UPI001E489B57|nr:helix-turn-helix domain-containing protein [Enterococcus gallinarum]MCD4997359.1 helix-turn-helix domain-containing protein [Enterococcus gallinarum]